MLKPEHWHDRPSYFRHVLSDPSSGGAEGDSQWTAPFATRLDLDILEDLVEGAGGFVTDRCACRVFVGVSVLFRGRLSRADSMPVTEAKLASCERRGLGNPRAARVSALQ